MKVQFLISSFTLFLFFFSSVLALPSHSSQSSFGLKTRDLCRNPTIRKEWSAATQGERISYTNAVLCLATKPSRIGMNSTLYDDFAYVHHELNLKIHHVAQFLPWHRYFLHLYETALKDCGYTGAMMYWDWTLSSSSPSKAPVWSNTLGLGIGSNGTFSPNIFSRCIPGPFSTLRPARYGHLYHPHCITRSFISSTPGVPEMLGSSYTPAIVTAIVNITDFSEFSKALEDGPHAAVHSGIAGTTGDMGPLTSPNDPVFFLHHAMVDRLWWIWQTGGRDEQERVFWYEGREFEGKMARLEGVMGMMGLAQERKVGEFMSTETEVLCYRY